MDRTTFLDRALGRQTFMLPCTVSIEHTNLSLEAHVELEGFEVRSGDEVRVSNPPTDISFGDSIVCRCEAIVTRGGPLDALWARVAATFDFPELYDLSFTSRRQL